MSIMKNALFIFLVTVLITVFSAAALQAQIKDHQPKNSDYTGSVIKQHSPSAGANLSNLFNMKMSHSYSMNFGTAGGQMMNMNAYTNTMQFFFTEDLTGEVNLSLLHSPFGQPNLYGLNQNQRSMDVALNAQIDYRINDRMRLSFEVNRQPGNYGFYPGYGGYRNAPFQNGSAFGRY
jgi:hypothetical protein